MADKIFLRGGSWYRASAKQLPDDIDMDDIIYNPSAQYPEIEGNEGGGGSQTLQEVLTEGNDAGGLTIDNLADPSTDQQSATKKYVDNAGGLGYLVYTALLSQTGTDAPVATVLENTLGGTVVWTRQDTGIYIGTLADVFIENKTVVFAFLNNANSFEIQAGWLAGAIMIVTYDETWSNIDMTGGGAIEIRVYPA